MHEPLLDPDEAVRRGSLVDEEPRLRERGDYERGLAEADVVVSGEFTTATVLHNSMETHQAVVQWVGDGDRGAHLDAVHLGHPRRGRRRGSSCRRTRCA